MSSRRTAVASNTNIECNRDLQNRVRRFLIVFKGKIQNFNLAKDAQILLGNILMMMCIKRGCCRGGCDVHQGVSTAPLPQLGIVFVWLRALFMLSLLLLSSHIASKRYCFDLH